MASDGFSLEVVAAEFRKTKTIENEILLEPYIKGYEELTRVFEHLGMVFSFITSDLKEKIRILNEHRKATPEHFKSVQTMVRFELDNNLTTIKNSAGLLSGSRTLLRLHRALLFISSFLKKLIESNEGDSVPKMASKVYADTIANYHTWLIRNTAYVAMRTLPNKKTLQARLCTSSSEKTSEEVVGDCVKEMNLVYDVVQAFYKEHNILDLP
ncbi:ceramide-1-phosphate transfer protein-like [Anneissia japonica]|uniref:ceramide-1-phosphate transfer protein-like n=1 Tax=Anneissia japonica TaxID=1529436 RepID=UPI001425748A|nr:ceramide-1-phosphate transfer protein-like [Anneissia japonica]